VPKGIQIAIGAAVCAALLGWYGYSNLAGEGTYRYFDTLDELIQSGPQSRVGETLRVKGYVANGSIDRRVEDRQVRFAIQNDPTHLVGNAPATVAVHYMSLETPDLFQDGAEVVVEGRIAEDASGVFLVADNVLAKCPSKFQAMAEEQTASSEPDGADRTRL
jgi:cytochrome c-type biogenesis protein CcmE